MSGIEFDLLAQPSYVDIYGTLIVHVGSVPPDHVNDLRASEDQAGVLCKRYKQPKFDWGQGNLLPAAPHLATATIDDKVAGVEHVRIS